MSACACGWKKPLVCVISLEHDAVARLLVAVACPECECIYDAAEQDLDEVSDEKIGRMEDFVTAKLRAKLADA
jgi:hypothetical protein